MMLSHRDRGFGQVEDLAALHPGDRPPGQARPAPSAAARLVPQLPVRPGHLGQRAALMPVLAARLAVITVIPAQHRQMAPRPNLAPVKAPAHMPPSGQGLWLRMAAGKQPRYA